MEQEVNARTLTQQVDQYARELGADLVGFAPVSRWAKAPIEHSPRGIMPEAQNVIVVACHFLDAPTELGAEADPREPGPAMTEMNVSAMLHDIAFRTAKMLQREGHRALFVRQSGAWRYRAPENVDTSDPNHDRGWVGDMCHYYAAVCAGLGEVGWNNITLTPQFGPRQRFCSILTDAELVPTPMYDGDPLCDRCMMCRKHCPTQSFDKDASGRMRHIEVEGRRYEFPDRNLWRCAIGENFMLDVFAEEWKDRRVDEKLIVEMEERAVLERNELIKGWKMGMCLKYCMSPQRRYWDRDYCKAPRRRRDAAPDAGKLEQLKADLGAKAKAVGVDFLAAASAEDFAQAGINLKAIMPDAESAVVLGVGYPPNCMLDMDYRVARAEMMLGTLLQEGYGYSALPRWGGHDAAAALAAGLGREAGEEDEVPAEAMGSGTNYSLRMDAEDSQSVTVVTDRFGHRQMWRTIVTSAPLKRHTWDLADEPRVESGPAELTAKVKDVAEAAGADMVGIAPVSRIEQMLPQLAEIFAAEENYFVVEDKGFDVDTPHLWGGQGWPYNPEVRRVKLTPRGPRALLAGAKSVIVLGVGLLEASVDGAGRPPANKAGHFHTVAHEEIWAHMCGIQYDMARVLSAAGFSAAPAKDLCGLASRVAGAQEDFTASRFAAVAAGLGELGAHGFVLTPRFGARQRFVCLVTDAELEYDDVYRGEELCTHCGECVRACPMAAIDAAEQASIEVEGRAFRWNRVDRLRCDFSQRYGLIPESGGMYIGCRNNFDVPEDITAEYVCQAFEGSDRIQRRGYTPVVERCFTECRAHRPA